MRNGGTTALAAGLLLLCACGHESEPNGEDPPGDCSTPNRSLADGRCVAPGVQDSGCPAGELTLEDGSCLPAGIPPELCAEGFEPAGDGCEPNLPAEPCPAGQLALPGETTCREVAPCGAGRWGDIPVDGSTQYVDQAYAGADSDGSAERPWTTIGAAIAAADPVVVVALAAGSYAEDVSLSGKTLQLWGVCPARAEITGAGANFAIEVIQGADQSELHNLAVRSVAGGVGISGATDVVLDGVWIHDGAARAIDVEQTLGPASAAIRNCLLENNRELGIFVSGSPVSVERTVVRGTLPRLPEQTYGTGLWAEAAGPTQRAHVTVRHSVFEANHDSGILLAGSDGDIEAVLVRGTLPSSDEQVRPGGVQALDDDEDGIHSTLLLRSSVVDGNSNNGIHVFGSEATIEGVLIRGTTPRPLDLDFGDGLHAEDDFVLGQPSTVTMRSSTIAHNHNVGAFLRGCDGTIESTVVRDTLPRASDGQFGRGLYLRNAEDPVRQSNVTIRGSVAANNHDAGILVSGSVALIEGTAVLHTQPVPATQLFGRGIGVQMQLDSGAPASATVRACVVEQNHETGIFFGTAGGLVEDTVVVDTQPTAAHAYFGRGIIIQDSAAAGDSTPLVVRRTLVDRSRDLGIFVYSSVATLEQTLVQGTLPREVDGLFGDGVAVMSEGQPARAELAACVVADSSRAGVVTFGSEVVLTGTELDCNLLNLVREEHGESAGQVTDGAGNRCGCREQTETCQALTSGLEPPLPVEEEAN